jgi:serine/threonine-protein kinase
MAEKPPTEIGRYKILGELGRGGFGRVYRAYDPTVGRPVAVKILTQVSDDSRTRFRNEAMVAGNLGHRSIVTVYEYGTHEESPFLAMEYLEGQDLHQIITSRTPLSLFKKCNIMSEVAEGLHCAHQSGVVHRDMKPANIMVLRDGTVKIMDFGIARITRSPDATRLTQQGYLIGTLRYMAPEQLAGSDFDALCDIFGYGVVFYELLTGRYPFEAPDAQSLMYKLTFEEPPPIKDFVADVPDALQEVISKILHKDRSHRYQSLRDVQFDTEPIRMELQRGHVAGLLGQAEELIGQKQLEAAQRIVHEALGLEPSNRTARILREELQKNLQKQTIQPRIDTSLREGEEHLAQRRFSTAARAFESALALDRDNTYIQGRVEQARASEEQARRASQLLAEARKELEGQNLTAAYRIVSEALRHDPKNPDAAEFLRTIQAYVERRQAEQRVDDVIRQALGLMLIPDFDEAIALLTGPEADAQSPKIVECLESVRKEKATHERKQKLRDEMVKATDLVRDRRLQEAVQCLEALKKEFPDNQDALHLLAYAHREQAAAARSRAVERIASEARARADSQDFEGALAAIDKALKQFPGESALIRLLASMMAAKTAWERQRAIQSILTNCELLRTQKRFAEAIRTIDGAGEDYRTETALLDLRKQLEAEWNEQRRRDAVRQIQDRVESLLAESQPRLAVEAAQQALTRYPQDAGLAETLARAQGALREQERAQAIALIRSEAARHAAAQQFDQALQILERGLETWTDQAELLSERSTIREAKWAWEQELDRAAAVDKISRDARQRAESGDFDGALGLLDEGLRRFSDASSLREMRERTLADRERSWKRQRALQELEEVQRRALCVSAPGEQAKLLSAAISIVSQYPDDQEMQSAAAAPIALLSDIGRARQEMVGANFREALEICERYLAQHPDQVVFTEFKREVERAQRRAGINEVLSRASAEPDLQKRAQILGDGLKDYPDETAIFDELRLTRNQLKLIDSIVEKARACEQSGQWAEALEQWSSLLTIFRHYPNLNEEIDRVKGARDASVSQAIENYAQPIEQVLQGGDLIRASELLRRAQAEHPDATRLQELGRRMREISEKRKRARDLVARAEEASRHGRQDESQTCLRQAFQMDESDAELRKLILNKLIDRAQSGTQTDPQQGGTTTQPTFVPAAPRNDRKTKTVGSFPKGGQKRDAGNTNAKAAQRRAASEGRRKEESATKGSGPRETGDTPLLTKVDHLNPKPRRTRIRLLAAVVCAGGAVLGGIFMSRIFQQSGEIAVNVMANVSGTSVTIGEKKCVTPSCNLKIPPGMYTLRASAEGYKTVAQQLTIGTRQAPTKLALALEPLPLLLQVNTNFEDGTVYLDDQFQGELRNSRFTLSGLAPGTHRIRVKGSGADFQGEWKSANGARPELLQFKSSTDLATTIVASAGSIGSIACNCAGEDVTVDGAPAGRTASLGAAVALKDLKPGARQIAVGDRSLRVDIVSNPALNVFLTLDRNVGVLIVQTGEDKVKVFLNNRPYHATTEHGVLRIPADVGGYTVRVEKEGFVAPPPRSLVLKKGEEMPVTFALSLARAYLEIAGGVAGAQVRLDGQILGEIDRNGAFRNEVAPGPHTIELSKDEYSSVRISGQFPPGKTLEFGRGQVAMAKVVKNQAPDARQIEAQEWTQVAGSNNPDDFEAFIRNHPSGAHLDQARVRLLELREQSQAAAARQFEQGAWERVDQNNREQLQNYLSRFQNGAHAPEARARISEMERQAAEVVVAQRAREQKELELAKNTTDDQAIIKVLKDFDAAYNRKDLSTLQKLWNGVPVAAYRQQFKEAIDLRFELQLVGQPVVNGNSATVVCTRTLTYKGQSGGAQTHSERVKITLNRDLPGWLIRSITVY